MPLLRQCPNCGRTLRLPDGSSGRTTRCPACETSFAVASADHLPKARRSGTSPPVLERVEEPEELERPRPRRKRRADESGGGTRRWVVLGLVLGGLVVGLMMLVGGGILLVLFLLPIKSDEEVGPSEQGQAQSWGEVTDPNNDCSVRVGPGQVTMTVPGTAHDLNVESGLMNAPRVLQSVDGDFEAQVHVSGILQPQPPSTVPGHVPYHGAGLLLWRDPLNYLRLERAALHRIGQAEQTVSLEVHENGRVIRSQFMPVANQDTDLHLERHGNLFSSSYRQGGAWMQLQPVQMVLPPHLSVGVAAINSSASPLSVRFDQFQATSRP